MTQPSPLWYATRGAGIVTLVLLSACVVLGLLLASRWQRPLWPRFLTQALHRDLSLTAAGFLALHVVTAILDPFAKLGISDAVVPFTSSYRPLWLGLGVLSMEIIVAITVTSLMRHRLGFRTWRAVHWLAYVSWPVALLHSLGTGTDTREIWALLIDAGCVAAVGAALTVRLTEGWPSRAAARAGGALAAAVAAIALGAWTYAGPLQAGWAKAAGTPSNLLGSANGGAIAATPQPGATPSASPAATPAVAASGLPSGLNDRVSGSISADGSSIQLFDLSRRGLTLTIAAGNDGGLTLVAAQDGTQVCSGTVDQNGNVFSGTCGGTEVQLRLRGGDDDSRVSGTLVTGGIGRGTP